MGFTRSTTDIIVHQKLGDYPNQDNGLDAQELKKRYDLPAETLQSDLNQVIEELEKESAAGNIGAMSLGESDSSANTVQGKLLYLLAQIQNQALGTIPDGTITESKIEPNFNDILAKRNGELQENLNVQKLGGETLAEVLEHKNYIVGSYNGTDGIPQEGSLSDGQVINIGFNPSFVFIKRNEQNSFETSGCAVKNLSYVNSTITIIENGFIIKNYNASGINDPLFNLVGKTYFYIAFK